MRIAFLTSEYVTEKACYSGGLANYLHRVARGLTARGHQVEIFTMSDRNEMTEDGGFTIHRVRPDWKWFFRVNRFLGSGMPITKGMIVESYCLRRRFLEQHAGVPFDIVQAPSFRASGLALSISSPVPVVTRASSYARLDVEAYGLKRTWDQRMRQWLERQALLRSVRLYAPSAFLAGTLTKELGRKVDVVRPPFFVEEEARDLSVYESTLKGLEYLLFVGTIGRLKGVFVLADALREVLPRFPEMHVVLAGRDVKDETGLSMIEKFRGIVCGFENRIHHLGLLPHSKLYPVVERARVVALPSLVDNLPNTCMEAMAFGRVVVASNGVSFDELIEDGKSGFLAEPGDPRALAASIARAWCLTESQRALIGDNARENIVALAPDSTLAELEKLYATVIADYPKRKRTETPSAELENWSKATEEASVAARKRQ